MVGNLFRAPARGRRGAGVLLFSGAAAGVLFVKALRSRQQSLAWEQRGYKQQFHRKWLVGKGILNSSVSPHGDAWQVVHIRQVCLWTGYCFQAGLLHAFILSKQGFAGWRLLSLFYLERWNGGWCSTGVKPTNWWWFFSLLVISLLFNMPSQGRQSPAWGKGVAGGPGSRGLCR